MLFYYQIISVECAEVVELTLFIQRGELFDTNLIPCGTTLYAVCTSM